MRQQKGQVIRISKYWYVRYWQRRNIDGIIQRKRYAHPLGPVTTRGKRAPADVVDQAERFMATINSGRIPPAKIVTLNDFVRTIYLPSIEKHNRPSTRKGYREIWEHHVQPLAGTDCLKDIRTCNVQSWLDNIGSKELSRNTLKHIKSVISGIFSLAKRQGYFDGINPVKDTRTNPAASEPSETYAYTLEEIHIILALLEEPVATMFAVAAFMGLRAGEIEGLLWENYRDGAIFVSRSIWNGHITRPKTRKGHALVPVIRPLRERLEIHRVRCGSPTAGPIFPNGRGKPLALGSVANRLIVPALNRCATCGRACSDHNNESHQFERNPNVPKWHGWHAARRGLGSNLYRLGVPEKTIQRVLRHANVSTTANYYIKTADDDVRKAMNTLEREVMDIRMTKSDTDRTLAELPGVSPATVQ